MAEDRITAALRGPTPTATAQQGGDQGDGTAQSGYATPDFGPFECENCTHFDGQGKCDHPQVISDPEVQGNVDAEGCCNLFKSAHSESQAEEHNEGEGE